MPRRLFELATEDGTSISPYVWRSKFALAQKQLPYQSELVGFTSIPEVGAGTFKSLPILEDGGEWIADSWDIADHLDRVYPDRPLFASAGERGTALFFEKWLGVEVISAFFRICVFDIHNRLGKQDREYFRATREKRLGQSLEEVHETREAHLLLLRERLQPLRLTVRDSSFIGGDAPAYADYIAAAAFIWAGSVATVDLLGEDVPLLGWLGRCFALHGGIGEALSLPGLPGLHSSNGAP